MAWALAAAGVVTAFIAYPRLSARTAAPLHIGAILFVIDSVYVCILRNQSYIHDFACFYFLIPVAVFSGFFIERMLGWIESRRPAAPALAATTASCLLAAGLISSGVRKLDGIDTQFCILDDDDTEPDALMPDLGRLIDRYFSVECRHNLQL